MWLHELPLGQAASIRRLHHEGSRLQRLLEMGLIEGSPVTVIRRAPLGDPMEIKVGDYHLSLRKEDAKQIEVA